MSFDREIPNLEKFKSLEQEVEYLRKKVLEKEFALEEDEAKPEREVLIKNQLKEYSNIKPEQALDKGHLIPEHFRNEIVLDLAPEQHDHKMSELMDLMYQKGILNTISIVESFNDPHLSDDFHRFLVAFLKGGYDLKGLSKNHELLRVLKRTLYEITLPERKDKASETDLIKLISLTEQFYSGMLSLSKSNSEDDYISLEVSNAIGSREFVIYICVPDILSELFEKQILSVFPVAQLKVKKDDYNIFNQEGFSVGAYALLDTTPAKPLKTYDQFSNDPMKVILNIFSKIDEEREGAAIQFIFKPCGDFYLKNYSKAYQKIKKGEKNPDELFLRNTFESKVFKKFSEVLNTTDKLFKSKDDKDKEKENKETDEMLIEEVGKKIESPIVSTNIRLVSSSFDSNRAQEIMRDLQSAFNQFDNTKGNKLVFSQIKDFGKRNFFTKFSFRRFDPAYDTPLNLKELATIFHIPLQMDEFTHQYKKAISATSPLPLGTPTTGLRLGENLFQGKSTPAFMAPEDRLRHVYIIGQTGTGKTNLMRNMIIQDIKKGEGVCFIDPHGSDIQQIMGHIPKERFDDVIYFDPAYIARPMALNMLEYDQNFPEQKTFVVNELFSIFKKLYGSVPESMGPAFEQYFRNSALLVMEHPESGNTLIDVSRILSDKRFRDFKLSKCKNPLVSQFWRNAEKTTGEQGLANYVQYVSNKFDNFIANEIMRPIIAQEKSSFNFREIMDNKKIFLINLSKGRLGDLNANLIGLILVGKFLMAALSRVDSFGKQELPPFYLYIDEFQNVTTDSISTILSEARKYKLSLTVAHQFIKQIDEGIKNSVFGNVGSMFSFRISAEDAAVMELYFQPTFMKEDIMNIENFNAYVKMLAYGVPVKPFNVKADPPQKGNLEQIEPLKQLSYLTYGKSRNNVESSIINKFSENYGIGESEPTSSL